MQIGEFARLAEVTPRALRHYEEQGLLAPERTPSGYRVYDSDDVATVHRIRAMIAAGLSTQTIATYLDCLGDGQDGLSVEMCPSLRAELDSIAQRLDNQQEHLDQTRRALCSLSATPRP